MLPFWSFDGWDEDILKWDCLFFGTFSTILSNSDEISWLLSHHSTAAWAWSLMPQVHLPDHIPGLQE
jgi:hypothetical protein